MVSKQVDGAVEPVTLIRTKTRRRKNSTLSRGVDMATGMNLLKLALYSWISRLFLKVYSLFMALLMLACACHAQPIYTIDELQGAWWSDTSNPTADFAITNEEVWLDFDASYHPCSITNGDVLVFELGSENGTVEQKIISLDATTLVLENPVTSERVVYTRNE